MISSTHAHTGIPSPLSWSRLRCVYPSGRDSTPLSAAAYRSARPSGRANRDPTGGGEISRRSASVRNAAPNGASATRSCNAFQSTCSVVGRDLLVLAL